ncbi:uncharacterized protein N7469_000356 [Penicillium citrinum]|uniref:DUF7702 domain-containing protein n=1 Tax=Penicillium citrinum TaxID=5077 RepID=A0A9W9PCL9_PENCI|nr:uncharacterized protein N7469_000356 [Penicillium citrinum]KAJ5242029.1 hypothetical protein N7469_000356 [Penicillium citrinum]
MAGNGDFTYRDGIAAAQIVAFTVPFVYALYFRWTRRIGWFCVGFFTLLRIIGASCKLATIHQDTQGLWAAIFVCESLGMILIGKWMFLAPSFITWIDIGISIGGWVSVMHVEHPLLPTAWSQASMGLLAVIYIYLVGVFVVFWVRRHEYFEVEKWALHAVTVCVPLLAIRLAYSLIFIISSNMTFNAIKGNPTAYLVLTMLPEVAIVAVCTFVIATKLPSLQKSAQYLEQDDDGESQQELSSRS